MSETIPFSRQPLSLRSCSEGVGHERRAPLSGTWECRLVTLTPLCIQSHFKSALAEKRPPYVPGSSLRGMVRNVAEMMGAGCARYYGGAAPPHLRTCAYNKACVVCRIFGFTEGEGAWMGKVRFDDSRRVAAEGETLYLPQDRPPQLESYGPGWVIYPAVRPWSVRPSPRGTWCVKAGASFPFRVEYLSLDPEEYAVFKYALTLEAEGERLCHVLGYAKALGLGVCRVEIVKDESRAPGPELKRYRDSAEFRPFRELRRFA